MNNLLKQNTNTMIGSERRLAEKCCFLNLEKESGNVLLQRS